MKRNITSKLKIYLVNDGWGTRYKVVAEDLNKAFEQFDEYYTWLRRDIIGTEIDKLYESTVVTYDISIVSSRSQWGKEIFYIFEDNNDIYNRTEIEIL